MARQADNRKIIADFAGEMNNADAADIPEGAAQIQINLTSRTIGELATRKGFRFAAFDDETLITELTADE